MEDDGRLQAWLNEVLWDCPRRLAARLGIPDAHLPKRFEVIYALARALRYNPDDLRAPALAFLDALVHPLGDAMNAHPDDWVNLVEEGDHERVATAALGAVGTAELYALVVDLGCGRHRLACEAREVPEQLRTLARTEVSRRLVRMFTSERERAARQQ